MRGSVFATGILAGLLLVGERVASAQVPVDEAVRPARWTPTSDVDPFGARVDSVLELMTLEEKLGQLTLLSSGLTQTGPVLRDDFKDLVRQGRAGAIFNAFTVEHTNELQTLALEETRLGIPLVFAFDVIHGYKTIFPIPLGEAATWNPELIEEASRAVAREAASAGLHWTYSPMVDVSLDPRWGRIAESAGEDPLLNALFGRAKVRGYQGADLSASYTIMATAKHYAAYGAAEGGRDYNTVDVSERVLREIYLPPFKATVDAGVRSIMPGFNEYDAVPATANTFLLNTVLRGEWGFEGIVVSDYTAIPEMIQHGVAATARDAAELALKSTVDQDMQSTVYLNELEALLEEGRITEQQIDAAAARILRAKFELGLFEDPFRYADAGREAETLRNPEILDLAREVSRQAIVLLKNDKGLLPISKQLRRVAVLGPLADDRREMLGSWSGAGEADDVVTLLEGIRSRVSSQTEVTYARGVDVTDSSTAGFVEAVALARKADIAILALGERAIMSGEAASRNSLELPGRQEAFLRAVHATGTPVVLVLMAGRPLAIQWAADHVPAILNAWFLGTQAGAAIGDVLFGDFNPSGKLPVTFPRSTGVVPYYYHHKNTGRPLNPDQRYTSKYIDVENSPLYPFGYGLSYTTFAYSDLRFDRENWLGDDSLGISVSVRNAGERAGYEVVQLYTRNPVASVTRPVRQLRGFRRVRLAPGESETVTFRLSPSDLRYYDRAMNHVLEPGRIQVFVGTNVQDVLEGEISYSVE